MASYVVQNDPYVATDYSSTDYVGTTGDFNYVNAGYVTGVVEGAATVNAVAATTTDAVRIRTDSTSVVSAASVASTPLRIRPLDATLGGDGAAIMAATAIVRPGADLTSSATTTITGKRITGFIKELVQAGDETTWETALTWANPRQDVWAKRFDVTPLTTKRTSASLDVQSTLTGDGDSTLRVDIVVEGTGAVSTTARKTGFTSAQLNAVSDNTTVAFKNPVGTASIISSASLESSIQYVVFVAGTLQSNSSVASTPTRVRNNTQQVDAAATIAADTKRIRKTGTTLSASASVSSSIGVIGRGTTLKAGISSLSCDVIRQRNTLDYEITSFATVPPVLGGKLVGFAEVLVTESIATCSGQLFKYVIDPYRVYTVKTEGRLLEIVPETRISTVKSENRLNTVIAESRALNVKSETRKLEVQNLALVDVLGPNDRRK